MRSRHRSLAAAAVIAAASLASGPARADAAAEARALVRGQMWDYFSGEKSEALVFVVSGAASTTAGIALGSRADAYPRAAGITMASIGLVEVAAGVFYYLSIDKRTAQLEARLAEDPAAFRSEELARIGGVSARFVLFKLTEVALICAGVGLVAAGDIRHVGAMKGIGLGLAVEAASFLTLDLFAEERAHAYTRALRRFPATGAFVAPALSPRGGAPVGVIVGLGGRL